MHRTKIKQLTPEGALLKKLREQRGLSMREAAELARKSVSWISHVENGRMDVSGDHLNLLLPLYGQTDQSFRTYLSGTAYVASPIRQECLDALGSLSDDLIEKVHPLLLAFLHLARRDRS